MERLFSPEEVAEYLNVKPEAVRIWLRTAKMRGSKLGNIWRISESAINEFLTAQENRPPQPSENINISTEKKPDYSALEPSTETFEEKTADDSDYPAEAISQTGEPSEQDTEVLNEFEHDYKEETFPEEDAIPEPESSNEKEAIDFADEIDPPQNYTQENKHDETDERDLSEERSEPDLKKSEEDEEAEKPPLKEKDKLRAVFDQFDPFG